MCRQVRSRNGNINRLLLSSIADDEALLDAITRDMRRRRSTAVIADLIGEGFTDRAIGERLHLAEKTSENYVSGLLSIMGEKPRAQASATGRRSRLSVSSTDTAVVTRSEQKQPTPGHGTALPSVRGWWLTLRCVGHRRGRLALWGAPRSSCCSMSATASRRPASEPFPSWSHAISWRTDGCCCVCRPRGNGLRQARAALSPQCGELRLRFCDCAVGAVHRYRPGQVRPTDQGPARYGRTHRVEGAEVPPALRASNPAPPPCMLCAISQGIQRCTRSDLPSGGCRAHLIPLRLSPYFCAVTRTRASPLRADP